MATSTLGSGTLVLAGTTSGTTTVTATAVAGTTTLTLPAATDTLVGKATTDTLTNKTLTTPSVSSPTISDGTANGVAFLNGSKVLTTGSALVFDGTNVGQNGAASAWAGAGRYAYQINDTVVGYFSAKTRAEFTCNYYYNGSLDKYIQNGYAGLYLIDSTTGNHTWYTAPNNTSGADATMTNTSAMTLDASGNLLVGTTSVGNGLGSQFRGTFLSASGGDGVAIKCLSATAGNLPLGLHNSAASGDNSFVTFYTEASPISRGSITYNRAGGLVAYNTTSDYRAKDISGPVIGSGALIDSIHVYMGTMKGATQERPMFIAHETPAYAHSGEKDAVDKDGNPVYQQMDTSALVPVMWAEIQSLRKRLAALESA